MPQFEGLIENEMYKLELLESWARVDGMSAIDKFIELTNAANELNEQIQAAHNHPEFLLNVLRLWVGYEGHQPIFIDRIVKFKIIEASPELIRWKCMCSGFVSRDYDEYRKYWMIHYESTNTEREGEFVTYKVIGKQEIQQWKDQQR